MFSITYLKHAYFLLLCLNLLIWFEFFFNRCKAVVDHFGQRISANYFIVEDSYLSESVCENVCYRYVVKQQIQCICSNNNV